MMNTKTTISLTIAGSDPCGGAGIQADLKTFQALRVYGTAVITALTVQNTTGVKAIDYVGKDMVNEQLDFLLKDFLPDAAKTGLLGRKELVEAVARKAREFSLPNLVVDPIIRAGDDTQMLDSDALASLQKELLPLATVVTPNILEAQRLCGFDIKDVDDMRKAAESIASTGVANVIITGGHKEQNEQVVDVLFDGKQVHTLQGSRIPRGERVHGTGCVFSAALTARLARGEDILTATRNAQDFVYRAIRNALDCGKGNMNTNTVF